MIVDERGERHAFGPAGAGLRGHRARARRERLARAAARQHGPGRELRRRPLGLRRPRHAGAHRGARDAPLRPGAARARAAQRLGRLVPRNTRAPLAAPHRRALRPRRRPLRALPRRVDDVLGRRLRRIPARRSREAQEAKLERICRTLELRPDDHLLEIGTGWGSLAVHAARRYGCRVTTTTISRSQHAAAVERVREAGLERQVTVLLQDYRELAGRYDKLVSIEMIEAVGWQYFEPLLPPLRRAARRPRG